MEDLKECQECKADLLYEVDGKTYSRVISVEIRGVYDGGLFYMCPNCEHRWHRWPEGHRLRKVAKQYVEEGKHG